MAESGITTGQYVRIQPTVASVGDRIFAQIIDWCVLLAYLTLMIWISASLGITNEWFMIIAFTFPPLFYTLLCEIFNNGRSLGKMAMKMRVVKLDGSSPTLGAYLMRWLLYLVDGPLTSFIGLLVIVLSRNNQRLGDMAAGTVVIKKQKYSKIQISLDEYDYLIADGKGGRCGLRCRGRRGERGLSRLPRRHKSGSMGSEVFDPLFAKAGQ